jgi:hypothetical protein
VPNQPATPAHTVRASVPLWDLVRRAAADDGTTITAVVLAAIVRDLRRRYPYEEIPDR